ncbi:MAG: Helix-turn-helix domain-containing protein [Chloroflexi bacterium]|jgi:excisionase family DNA binding protein|nr:MAG: Helix-turn-helix domain-containing protein [Chloroflexota bacterium]
MMRISAADFEMGNVGWVHQAILEVVPEEEAVDESELRSAYESVDEEGKPSFEEVMEHLSGRLIERNIGGRNFYIRRKAWLSSGEVAKRLGVSLRTVQAWGQRGVLGAQYMGDRLRFAAENVEEWVRGKRSGIAFDQSDRPAVSQVWDNEEDAKYDRL